MDLFISVHVFSLIEMTLKVEEMYTKVHNKKLTKVIVFAYSPKEESLTMRVLSWTPFKDGAFRLAIEHHLPIVPMIFHDNKKRFSYTFFSGGPGKIRALIHKPLATTNYSLEMKKELKAKTRAIILNELENPSL